MIKLIVSVIFCIVSSHPLLSDPLSVGQKAPSWEVTDWANSTPLSLEELAGKVVIVRWMMPGCPFCTASTDVLNTWHQTYRDQGLVIVGFWFRSSKIAEVLTVEKLKRHNQRLKIRFPTAYDRGNKTAMKWMGKTTSPSVLIDKRGMVRYVHPEGEYVKAEEEVFRMLIQQLLDEEV